MEFPSSPCFNWVRLCLFSSLKNLNKVYNKMKKRKTLQKNETNKVKLIDPLMKFNTGLLVYEIDIPKTKKLLKWLRRKKK